MRTYTLHNIGHENNVRSLTIGRAVFALYRDKEQKDRMEL